MPYLHCHTKGCTWSQDDFYTKGYNPLTKMWTDIKWLGVPKIVSLETSTVKDLINFTHVPIIKKPSGAQYLVFSWNWLVLEIVKDLKVMLNMKWWTYRSFKKSRDLGVARCPVCKKANFDID